MTSRHLAVVVLALLAGCAVPDERAPAETVAAVVTASATRPREATTEWRLLRQAVAFLSDAVGEGGDLPALVIAYRQLLRAPDGAATFGRLLREGTPAARLYALCGLRELAPAEAAERAEALLADETLVSSQVGCVSEEGPLRSLAARLLDDGDDEMARWRAGIRGTGRGWREGEPFADAPSPTDLVEALEPLCALDAALGNGPPPPWSTTAAARATDLDEEEAESRDEEELERLDAHLAEDPLDGPRDALAGRFADRGPAAIPALVAALRHRSPSARLVALRAIERLGRWAAEASPAIVAALDDPDVRVRWTAIQLLAELPDDDDAAPARAGLLRALDRADEESELLCRALSGLDHHEAGPDEVPHLVPLLRHRHPEVAERAAMRLAEPKVGRAAAEALPLVVAAVHGWPERRVSSAVWLLAALPEELAAPVLADLLVEVEGRRQEALVGPITELSSGSLELVVGRVLARTAPARARLLATARAGPERVGALAAALEELTLPPRLVALVALGREPEGVAVLEGVVAGEDGLVEQVATDALASLGRLALPALDRVASPARVASVLWSLLRSDEPLDRVAALEWFASAPSGGEAEQVLVQAVRGWLEGHPPGPRAEDWDAAVGVLLRWSTAPARQLLERLATHQKAPPDVRRRVAEALGR